MPSLHSHRNFWLNIRYLSFRFLTVFCRSFICRFQKRDGKDWGFQNIRKNLNITSENERGASRIADTSFHLALCPWPFRCAAKRRSSANLGNFSGRSNAGARTSPRYAHWPPGTRHHVRTAQGWLPSAPVKSGIGSPATQLRVGCLPPRASLGPDPARTSGLSPPPARPGLPGPANSASGNPRRLRGRGGHGHRYR